MRRHDDEMRRHEVEMRRREEDDLVEGGRRSSNVSSQSASSPISPSTMEHDHSLGETFSFSGGKKSFFIGGNKLFSKGGKNHSQEDSRLVGERRLSSNVSFPFEEERRKGSNVSFQH